MEYGSGIDFGFRISDFGLEKQSVWGETHRVKSDNILQFVICHWSFGIPNVQHSNYLELKQNHKLMED